MAEGTEGKASSGAKFRPPPANIWNSMIDAGRDFANRQLDQPGQQRIRPRKTDLIKIQNSSGTARRRGEILAIDDGTMPLSALIDEFIWLKGIEPTATDYFGILKDPAAIDGIELLHVSGTCIALVNITDETHTHADAVAGEYVMGSSGSGPIEILYSPDGIGEKECVVRWGGGGGRVVTCVRFEIVSSDPTTFTALAEVLAWDYGFTIDQVPDLIVGEVIEICDPRGCYLNEPNADLIGRQGTAVYRQGVVDDVCRPNGYVQPFPGVWEVDGLCCQLISCDVVI